MRQNKSGGKQEAGATADGYRLKNMSLLLAVLTAYVPTAGGATFYTNNQIQGVPEWVTAERYDIDARVPDAALADWQKKPLQEEMLRSMLQSLLAERCKLTVHREMKDVATFSLVIGKHGPKLQEGKPDVPHPGGIPMPGGAVLVPTNNGQTLNFYGATMVSLAQVLTNFAGRPVKDMTGLTGKYDFSLQKSALPEQAQLAATDNEAGMSIFTSLQEQLGLKLEPMKGSVEILVIDHLERPAEN